MCPDSYKKPYLDVGMSDPDAAHYGMITNIDDNVGWLMKNLVQWGLDKRTLVILMTDNGHARGNLYNAGMRGSKGGPYQGGTRVPAFFSWTGTLQAGVDIDKLAAHIDIFPTLAELAGATVPSDIKLDGRSLVPLLQDPNAEWADRFIFVHQGRWAKGMAVQSKYKNCAVRNSRFRLVNNEELYDIKNDPGETTNVISQHADVVEKMRKAYDRWWEEVLPAMENEDAVGPKVNPFKERYWKQFGGGPEEAMKGKMEGTTSKKRKRQKS